MATDLDNFGKGVFDEPVVQEEKVQETVADESPIELTDREKAIAMGEDPDAPPVEDVIEDEQESVQEQPTSETDTGKLDEPQEVSAEGNADPFSLGDRKLAQKYGLSEEDLQKFGSPEALHHALDIFDKSGIKVESAKEDSTESPAENSAEDAAAEDNGGALSELLGFEKLDVSKYENASNPYDEETIELVKHVRKTEDLLERITQSMLQSSSNTNDNTFHDMLDNYPDVYGNTLENGKPVKISSEYEAARQAVKDQAETIYAGIVARKGDVPPVEKIIEQAMMAVHGKAIQSKSSSSRADKLKKQSSMKRSAGSSATNKRRQQADIDPSDASQIARHPDVEAFFRKAQEENGAV